MSTTTTESMTGHDPIPHFVTGSKSTGWWGIVMLLLIETAVFTGLIASYFYLFANSSVWPAAGASNPELGIPIVYSIILFASGILGFMGNKAMEKGDLRRMQIYRIIGAVSLVVFLGLKAYEYINLDYLWNDSAYASIMWTIAMFHSAHVFSVLLKEIAIQALAAKGFFTKERRGAVEGATLYWNYVVLMWIPIFLTLYIFPNYV